MKAFICIFFTVLAVTGYAATTLEIKKDCKECGVVLHVKATKFMSFDVDGSKPVGKLEDSDGKVSGEVTVPWADFHSTIEGRADHMKEIFKTKEYPNVSLKVKDLPSTDGEHDLVGELSLLGQYKPIKGKYKVKTEGKQKKFRAEFDVDFTQWGLEEPSKLGVVVKTPVNVIVDGVAGP